MLPDDSHSPETDPHSHGWEDQRHIPIVSFDFASFDVDIKTSIRELHSRLAQRDAELASVLLKLMCWITADGEGRTHGIAVRCYVVQWLLDGNLRNIPLAAYARRHGLTKQLFQRECRSFRTLFGYRDSRFYSDSASTSAVRREEKKRNHA